LIQTWRVTINSNTFHHVDDVSPAGRIKLILKHEIRLVASGAIVPENGFHPPMLEGVFGKSHHPFRAGELFREILNCFECEILLSFFIQVDLCEPRFKTDGLCRNVVVAFGQGREIVAAFLVGKDTGCDGLSVFLRRDHHTFESLAGGRFYGAG